MTDSADNNADNQEKGERGKEKGANDTASKAPFASFPVAPDAELYAGVDVGTNSVKMIVADLAHGRAISVYDQTIITRLGEGMQALGGRLSLSAMNRTLDALAELAQAAQGFQVRGLAVVGTAALRDAVNRDAFLKRVQARCGLDIQVIAGEEEARLSYLAVRRDPQWRDLPSLRVIDIGGGSTEIIEGVPDTDAVAARISVPYGAVRLTEAFLKSDPPTIAQLDQANRAVRDAFARIDSQAARDTLAFSENTLPALGGTPPASDNHNRNSARVFDPAASYTLVGVGGTVTNLGAINQGGRDTALALHGHALTADRLGDHIDLLAQRTVEQRKTIAGLDPRRADIILGGAILLAQALARLDAPAILISTRGLRWGLLYDRFT